MKTLLAICVLLAACAAPSDGSVEQPIYGNCGVGPNPQKHLVLRVREFGRDGSEVPCDGDLAVTDGDLVLPMTGCSGLDASSLTYGTSVFDYVLPDAAPRRLRVVSRSHRRMCPLEFTVQLASQDGTCEPAQRFLSTQDCGTN